MKTYLYDSGLEEMMMEKKTEKKMTQEEIMKLLDKLYAQSVN